MISIILGIIIGYILNILGYFNRLVLKCFGAFPEEYPTAAEQNAIAKAVVGSTTFIGGCPYVKPSLRQQSLYNLYRYTAIVKSAVYSQIKALLLVITQPHQYNVQDDEIANILNYTIMGRLLQRNREGYYIDCSVFDGKATLSGLFTYGTYTTLNEQLYPTAITIQGHTIYPRDTAWLQAKMYFVANLVHYAEFYCHAGRIHSVYAYFNSTLISHLDPNSKVALFLKPHFTFNPSLNNLYFMHSHYSRGSPIGCVAYPAAIINFLQASGVKDPNNCIVPIFTGFTVFDQLLQAGYQAIFSHVRRFLQANPDALNDNTREWLNATHLYLNFVPSGESINLEGLQQVLTFIVWLATISHSLDHASVSMITPLFGPLRNQKPLQLNNCIQGQKVNRCIDQYQQYATYFLFSKTKPHRRLINIKYDASLNIDTTLLKQDLRAIAAKCRIFNLDYISTTVDT